MDGSPDRPLAREHSDTGWEQIERLLFLARTHLGMDLAWLSQFNDGRQVFRATSGDAAAMNVMVDEGTPLEGSFCTRVLAGTLPSVINDARLHPTTRELAVTRDLNIGSYIGVPWRGEDNETAGMLCCLSRTSDPALDDQARRFLALIADLVSDHVSSPLSIQRRTTDQATAVLRSVLDAGSVRMVFQPVVRLQDGTVVAYEALARFDDTDFPTPAHAFAAAAHAGLGVELEILAVRRAFERLDDLPPGTPLAVNLSAEAMMAPQVQAILLTHAHRGISVELTEHTQVSDYPALITVARRLRAAGVLLAIDDAGSGFASLSHILQLRPDTIKLDISLVRGIDIDPVRAALARSLVIFAHDIGATLIAEGIETRAEHRTLQELGVLFGQGYFMARPGPLPANMARPEVDKVRATSRTT